MTRVHVLLVLLASGTCCAFLPRDTRPATTCHKNRFLSLAGQHDSVSSAPHSQSVDTSLPQDIAGQFKILTCSATSCAKKRIDLGLDEYSTFSAFYMRAKDMAPSMTVEEKSCLGCCKAAPCVGIEHEDYEGTVSLEGMTQTEFSDRVFQNVCWEEDADRVWASVENAIRVLAEDEGGSDDDDDEGEEQGTETQGVEV